MKTTNAAVGTVYVTKSVLGNGFGGLYPVGTRLTIVDRDNVGFTKTATDDGEVVEVLTNWLVRGIL